MLNWEPGEKPDRAEQIEAGKGFLKAIGMENAQAVFVAHDDKPTMRICTSSPAGSIPRPARHFRRKTISRTRRRGACNGTGSTAIKRESGLDTVAELVERRDYAALLDHFTKDRPTFSRRRSTARCGSAGSKDEQAQEFRRRADGAPVACRRCATRRAATWPATRRARSSKTKCASCATPPRSKPTRSTASRRRRSTALPSDSP